MESVTAVHWGRDQRPQVPPPVHQPESITDGHFHGIYSHMAKHDPPPHVGFFGRFPQIFVLSVRFCQVLFTCSRDYLPVAVRLKFAIAELP